MHGPRRMVRGAMIMSVRGMKIFQCASKMVFITRVRDCNRGRRRAMMCVALADSLKSACMH